MWVISSLRVKYFILRETLISKYISHTCVTIASDIVSYMIFVVRNIKINIDIHFIEISILL